MMNHPWGNPASQQPVSSHGAPPSLCFFILQPSEGWMDGDGRIYFGQKWAKMGRRRADQGNFGVKRSIFSFCIIGIFFDIFAVSFGHFLIGQFVNPRPQHSHPPDAAPGWLREARQWLGHRLDPPSPPRSRDCACQTVVLAKVCVMGWVGERGSGGRGGGGDIVGVSSPAHPCTVQRDFIHFPCERKCWFCAGGVRTPQWREERRERSRTPLPPSPSGRDRLAPKKISSPVLYTRKF